MSRFWSSSAWAGGHRRSGRRPGPPRSGSPACSAIAPHARRRPTPVGVGVQQLDALPAGVLDGREHALQLGVARLVPGEGVVAELPGAVGHRRLLRCANDQSRPRARSMSSWAAVTATGQHLRAPDRTAQGLGFDGGQDRGHGVHARRGRPPPAPRRRATARAKSWIVIARCAASMSANGRSGWTGSPNRRGSTSSRVIRGPARRAAPGRPGSGPAVRSCRSPPDRSPGRTIEPSRPWRRALQVQVTGAGRQPGEHGRRAVLQAVERDDRILTGGAGSPRERSPSPRRTRRQRTPPHPRGGGSAPR